MHRDMGTQYFGGLAAVAFLCSSSLIAAEDAVMTTTCHDCQEGVTENMGMQLLQQKRSLKMNAEALTLPTPVTWMHVPRTGTSFMYTLLYIKSLCHWGAIHDDYPDVENFKALLGLDQIKEHCPGLFISDDCDSFMHSTEMNIGMAWSTHKGKVVGFFRQPEVRIMSEFYNSAFVDKHNVDIKKFRDQKQGCVTKILTSGNVGGGHCDSTVDGLPTLEEVELAKHRVETGFAFIGMTDDWDLSICLFNAMYGVQCHVSQFTDYAEHATTQNSSNVSALLGWTDPFDGPVWEVADRKFTEALQQWDMSPETCTPSECS